MTSEPSPWAAGAPNAGGGHLGGARRQQRGNAAETARKQLGIELRVLSGAEEAQAGFLGAVRGLPVEDGAQFDVGGGSMQVCLFRSRRLGGAWSFPLGSLRLSDAFLSSDPPSQREQNRLVGACAGGACGRAPGAPAGRGGTGGHRRHRAEPGEDRSTLRGYPIARLHGYQLSRKSVREIVSLLAARPAKRRAAVPGLNDDRADSIVGGALVVLTLMKVLGAGEVQVSGQGVREGLAAGLVSEQLPPPVAVRESSVAALAGVFRRWDARLAEHRMQIADALFRALEGDGAPELREMVQHGARLLDVGRSIDFFDRHEHVADIVLATDLQGFSTGAWRCCRPWCAVRATTRRRWLATAPPDKRDRGPVAWAATLLALADEIEERCPDGAKVKVPCKISKDEARIAVTGLAGWRPRRIASRFERDFGRRLVVTPA